jgi:hypothetical protein
VAQLEIVAGRFAADSEHGFGIHERSVLRVLNPDALGSDNGETRLADHDHMICLFSIRKGSR